MASAEIEISFYEFMNPHLKTDISVETKDDIGKFSIEKAVDKYRPIYRLELHDLSEFGIDLESEHVSNRAAINRVVQDMITAINLTTLTGVATRQITRIDGPSIDYTDQEKERIGEQRHAEMKSNPNQPISEEAVFNVFQMLEDLEREHELGSSNLHLLSSSSSGEPMNLENFVEHKDIPKKAEINLLKALNVFDGAMNSIDKSIQHLLLFIALETATNVKEEKEGKELEKAMSDTSGLDQKYIEQWRELYKRQKHADSESALKHQDYESMDTMKKLSLTGITDSGLNLHGMRKAASSAIQDALIRHM